MEDNNIWSPADMLEIVLNEPDDFLKVRETLTRIGVASRKEKKLFQSCHILHKQGRYFIVHFKELFLLDGKKSNLEELYETFTYDEIYKNKCFEDPIYPESFSESSLVFNQDILNNSNSDLDISTENLYDNIN